MAVRLNLTAVSTKTQTNLQAYIIMQEATANIIIAMGKPLLFDNFLIVFFILTPLWNYCSISKKEINSNLEIKCPTELLNFSVG